ncbi:prolyl-tRNA synthetase associated domain-containing protein [Candidatus Peregrinibacteria bacterium]|nr:prolyl-tRNA synthetase associated domain-containing protein [Candidatus Peregrinibacteria bacterium]
MIDIESFLKGHGIAFRRFEHPAVFTCEESERLCPEMPGMHTKNLFLKDDKKRRHILLSLPHGKVADLKEFGKVYGIKSPSLASAEDLKKYLGVEPGAVTLLGLVHDTHHHVEVFLDEELWKHNLIGCHPLVNTATLVIAREDMERFFAATGHQYRVCSIPAKSLSLRRERAG